MKNRILAMITGLLLALPVGAATYGPVAPGETLWSIASRTRPSYDISTQQMMLTLRMKNPQAFTTQNINSLKKGAMLQLPTQAELQRLNPVQAMRTAKSHNKSWQTPVASKPAAATARKASGNRTVKTSSAQASLGNARQTQARLRREISTLKKQLGQEQQRGKRLASQVRQLQASSGSAAGAGASPDVARLQAELTDLKSVLSDKDNHIKNLQISLKEASESIKRQHSENLALYQQLKAVDPKSVAAKPAAPTSSKGELTLAGVGAEQPVTKEGKPAVFTDQLTGKQQQQPADAAPATAPAKNGVPLKDLLEPSPANSAPGQMAGDHAPVSKDAGQGSAAKPAGEFKGPSQISFIIALISLLFILALLWRAFNQQRVTKRTAELRKQEAAPRNQETASGNDKPAPPDGRQEPEIVF
ncbi:MAG: hypothetical protein KJ914_01545 [Gammaproteobacteria bacterium]|nr:hypothetical protein [Gammaproteobacteria bacterium]MBU1723985.1 hypothetical protein [Gammaproteobacteria bacterium]MBU2005536.1 hypothetical protein [Gammaproteobacteria bacterium]